MRSTVGPAELCGLPSLLSIGKLSFCVFQFLLVKSTLFLFLTYFLQEIMNEIIKYVIFTHMLDLCLQTLATQNNIYAYKSSQGYIEKTTERERGIISTFL